MQDTDYQKQLLDVREEIDAIDKKLLPLFVERMKCSEKVAGIKQSAGMPVFNAEREQQILERVAEEAGELGSAAKAFYSAIMSISRARQHNMLVGASEIRELEAKAKREMPNAPDKIICQGVQGAYSHKAAQLLFGEAPISFVPEFRNVFDEIEKGENCFGVLPVENSAAGSVTAVYDLILKYRFYIVGAVDVKVEHCIAVSDASSKTDTVVSHPQGLSQCSEYIEEHGYKRMEYSNTATAAKFVAEEKPKGVAVICSKDAAEEYGLHIVKENIQNEKSNTTRFVVISKSPILPIEANKISLCFSIPHTTGSLYNVLERFSLCGLNLTKIESRPIPGSRFEYDFYLDFSGNIHDKETLELICALHDELPRFSFLGNYSED